MRTLLKWNLIFILFFICLASCQKETPQNQAGVKSLQEVETTDLDSFNSLLSDVRATMTSNLRNSGCANSRNPEDYQGERHNEILEELNVGGYINGSIDSLLVAFERHTQLAVEGSSSFYISLHDEMDSLIYFRDGSYNGAYLSSLSEVLPTVEIEILNAFFNVVVQCDTLETRIALSIATEDYVLASTVLSPESKDRMLACLAIYRHSTCFWDDKYSDTNVSLRLADVYDAIGAYIAQNCNCEPGLIEDGADVNTFASLFSAIMVALTR